MTSVPQVGYRMLVYPSPNKYAKMMTLVEIPGNGDKVKSGIKSIAFADDAGIKNSNTKMMRYSKMTEK